ncbi:MAG: GNAT family N-acetyltransferase [Bacteroidota bacterium]
MVSLKYFKIANPSKKEFEEIENFVKLHPNACYFQSTLFFKSCVSSSKLFPLYILAYDDNKLAGVLLVFKQIQINKPVFSFLSSRNIIWGGPLVLNNNHIIYEGLYGAYEKMKSPSIYTQVRNIYDMSDYKKSMNLIGFKYEEHLNIIVDLNKTAEQLWKEVHTKRRNEIRKALKELTTFFYVNNKEELTECYTILMEVYSRANLPLPKKEHFEALLDNTNTDDGLKIFVAKFDNKIIGCMLCLVYGDTVFDYFAGALSKYYNKNPNDLIPWEVFKWGKQNGYKKFDFGGAGKPKIPYGVREYKKKFGGEMVNYGRFEKVHFPFLFKLVSLGFNIVQKLN